MREGVVVMTDTRGRRIEEVGDAACAWHALDKALRKLCEARDALVEAGFEEKAETLQEVVEALEPAYAAAEENLEAEYEV